MFNNNSIPVARIKYKRIITFSLPIDRPARKGGLTDNFKSEDKRKAYEIGTLSHGAKKRLQRSIELLVDISRPQQHKHPQNNKIINFKLTFLTLTLSAPQQDISDKTILKQVFQPFLQILRRKYKCTSYVWRAEKQKNGNVHFHLTSNVFLAFDQIRDDWNRCQQHLGIIDRFEQQHGHRNPNSTDIHSVRKVHDLARYMIKYMSKSSAKSLPVDCKLWDCSVNLKIKDNVDIILDSVNYGYYEALKSMRGATVFIGDCFECLQMRGFDIRSYIPDSWKEQVRDLLGLVNGSSISHSPF